LRVFHAVLVTRMRWHYVTIAATVGLFAVSLFGMKFVQKQFFPSSNRPEILVTMMLPKNGSIYETRAEIDRLQKAIQGNPRIDRYSAYIGGGAIRFYLPLDVQLDNSFIAQFVIVAKGLPERDALIASLVTLFDEDFPNVLARVSRLELGPPVGWLIQYRVSAETPEETRTISEQLAAILRASPYTQVVNFDWSEKNKLIRVTIDQDKARRVGLSSDDVARVMNAILSGVTSTQVRDSIYLIDVVARAQGTERLSVETLRNLRITVGHDHSVPLSEIATIEYGLADGYLWQRNRLPTITVQADTAPGLQAPTVFQLLENQVNALRATLPPGAVIQDGGTIEKSAQSNAAIVAEFPLMVLAMLTVLMLQLQCFQRLFLVVSVAPLGLIGVVAMLLATRTHGLRRHARDHRACRDDHPQLADPHRSDRRQPRARHEPLGSGG
jgi:multidrug efflux pump subunit AcrB